VDAQIRQHTAQTSARELLVSRRSQDRSPTAKYYQAVPPLAAARVELKVDVPAPGETVKLPQQLVAVHCNWIAGRGVAVKGGESLHPGSVIRG
jgi:hypothetical protein